MDKQFFIDKTNGILNAPSACPEIKAAAENWLKSVGTDKEKEAAESYIRELEDDVTPIGGLIGLLKSDMGVKIFGKAQAELMLKTAQDAEKNGEKWCICPACNAGGAILDNRENFLKLAENK